MIAILIVHVDNLSCVQGCRDLHPETKEWVWFNVWFLKLITDLLKAFWVSHFYQYSILDTCFFLSESSQSAQRFLSLNGNFLERKMYSFVWFFCLFCFRIFWKWLGECHWDTRSSGKINWHSKHLSASAEGKYRAQSLGLNSSSQSRTYHFRLSKYDVIQQNQKQARTNGIHGNLSKTPKRSNELQMLQKYQKHFKAKQMKLKDYRYAWSWKYTFCTICLWRTAFCSQWGIGL